MEETNFKEINFNELLNEAINKPGKLLEAYKAFHNFSLGNRILAAIQCTVMGIPISPLGTFNQWKEKDRHVKKGSKALTLCMPIIKTRKKIVRDEKTGEEKEEKIKYTDFIHKKQWFTLSQTNGEEINYESYDVKWNKEKALKELNISEISFEIMNGNCQGYATLNNEIALNPLAQLPFKTLFHELAHIVLEHTKKETLVDSKEVTLNIIEAEAEATALLCLESLGLEGSDYCRGYIQNWLQGNEIPEKNAKKIIIAADKILKAGV